MDESAFRKARSAANPQPCAFERALLARCSACTLAERRNIAERELVACASPAARAQCAELLASLRQNAAFALKLVQADAELPHAKQMKLQCGALQGLRRVSPGVADDVHALVRAGAETFAGLANLPYAALVQSISAYQVRPRRQKA